MKTALRLSVVVVACAIIGYSGLWYYQANTMQRILQDDLNKVNQSGYGFSIEHEGFEKSGYPLSVQIGIRNPKIKMEEGDKKDSLVTIDGKVKVISSIFSSQKKIELEGKTYINLPKNELSPATKLLLKGDILGEMDSLVPFDVKIVCSQLGFFNMVSNQEVPKLHVDYASFHVQEKEGSKTNQRVNLGIDVRGLNFKELFKTAIGDHADNLAVRLNQVLYSMLDDINFQFALNLDIPKREKIEKIIASPISLLLEKFPTFSIEVEKFHISSKIVDSAVKCHLSLKEGADNTVSIHGSLDSNKDISDAYYTLFSEAITQVKKEVLATTPATREGEAVQKEQIGYLNTLQTSIPLIKKFSPNKAIIDWSVDFNKNGLSGKVLLSKFDIFNDSRGIYVHGKLQQQNSDVSGELVTRLKNYRQMIQDSIEFYNNVVFSMSHLAKIDLDLKRLPNGVSDQVIAYVKYISDKPADNGADVEITVSYKGGQPKVGTLDWQEFKDYSTHMMADIEATMHPEQVAQ